MKDHQPRVGDVMTRRVIALTATTPFKDVVKAVQRWHVSALPVVDEDRRVVGIVSESDLLPKEEFRTTPPGPYATLHRGADVTRAGARRAGELMTAPALTVRADAPLALAARSMACYGVTHLPVVDDDGVLQGIVSRSDLLKVFLREDADIAGEVERDIVRVLFPEQPDTIAVDVRDGVVTLTGQVPDTALVPLAGRLVRAVPGVVDVDCALSGPRRRPALDPDLEDDVPAGAGRA